MQFMLKVVSEVNLKVRQVWNSSANNAVLKKLHFISEKSAGPCVKMVIDLVVSSGLGSLKLGFRYGKILQKPIDGGKIKCTNSGWTTNDKKFDPSGKACS